MGGNLTTEPADRDESPALPQETTINAIYLDTNLWNSLLDENVGAVRLIDNINDQAISVTLSEHTVDELAKTFLKDPQRGKKLFRYVRDYLVAGVGITWDVMELLHLEVDALKAGVTTIDPLLGRRDLGSVIDRVDRLAKGDFDAEARSRVAALARFTGSTRLGQKDHHVARPRHRSYRAA
jgi:hypothetical protein